MPKVYVSISSSQQHSGDDKRQPARCPDPDIRDLPRDFWTLCLVILGPKREADGQARSVCRRVQAGGCSAGCRARSCGQRSCGFRAEAVCSGAQARDLRRHHICIPPHMVCLANHCQAADQGAQSTRRAWQAFLCQHNLDAGRSRNDNAGRTALITRMSIVLGPMADMACRKVSARCRNARGSGGGHTPPKRPQGRRCFTTSRCSATKNPSMKQRPAVAR